MKKTITAFLIAAVLSVGAMFALTACGGGVDNKSAGGVIKSYVTAQMTADLDTVMDCLYFEDESAKEEAREFLEGIMSGVKVTGTVNGFKIEVTKEYSEDEVKAYAETADITATVTAVKELSVTYSYDLKATMTVNGSETSMEQKGTEENEPFTVFEIDGKWYVQA